MFRWLLRLLLVGLILAAIGFVVSRLMGQDEDFDDFDDLDAGFEFQETPVEIDVPADDNGTGGTVGTATTALSAGDGTSDGDGTGDGTSDGDGTGDGTSDGDGATGGAGDDTGTKLTNITGIGPAYEARLQALGIESVDDLLSADPATLADQLGVIGGQSAVEDWLAQARQLSGDGSQEDNSNA
jgi:Helix-hairpin-helix domain